MSTRLSGAVLVLAALATAAGCGTRVGSQSSQSTSSPGHGPIVIATVIGQNPTSAPNANPVAVTVRSGADVVLSGKDSDSTDAAIKSFGWTQTGGQQLPAAPDIGALLYRTSSTASFRAPLVPPGAPPLTFRLTVTDAHGVTGTADVSVTVVPPSDTDQTLFRPELVRTFNVAVLTTDGFGGNALSADAPVCVQLLRTLNYQTRSAGLTGPNNTAKPVALAPLQLETAWKSGTTVTAAGAGSDSTSVQAAIDSFSNPRVTFTLPLLNDEEIFARYNQPGASNQPQLQLVPGDMDTAQMQVAVNATAGTCATAGSGAPSGPAASSSLIVAVLGQGSGSVAILGQDGVTKLQSAASVGTSTLSQLGAATPTPLTADTLLMAVTSTKVFTGQSTPFTNNPIETAASADAYYAAIDPTGSKKTLSAWLTANCFNPTASDYGVSSAGAGNGAHSVYTNNYDLGFGRDMYFIRCTANHTDASGNITAHAGDMASLVINYPSLELAALKQSPIIAVAMEYSAAADGSAPNRRFAKFYAFALDDRSGEFNRVRSANFDRRGQKYLPGSCTACHSGTPPLLPVTFAGPAPGGACTAGAYDLNSCYPLIQDPLAAPAGQPPAPTCAAGSKPGAPGCLPPGDLDAAFLPWDNDSFLYSDNDPAFKGKLVPAAAYTRASQESALKALNQLAHSTFKYGVDAGGADIVESVIPTGGTKPVDRYAAAKALTEYWYGGPAFPNATYADYTDSNPPAGWANQPTPLYHTVFARNCRTCHTIDADTRFQFSGLNVDALAANKMLDGYQKIADEFVPTNGVPGKGQTYLFQQALMPLARLTLDRYWVDFNNGTSAGNTLATAMQQTASLVGQPVINATILPSGKPLTPGTPVQGSNASTSRIDASASDFVTKYSWSLMMSPLQGFTTDTTKPACAAGSAGSSIPLVGDTGTAPGFYVQKSGLYRATLTPDNGVGQTGSASSYEYDVCVPNFQPAWTPVANRPACNDLPAAPFSSTSDGAPKPLGALACFSGLGNPPYSVGVSADGNTFAATTGSSSSAYVATVTCNGSLSGAPCAAPDVQFQFKASTDPANATTPSKVYFQLCDIDGDCTAAGGASLDVAPTSLKIQPAALVLYWAPCLNPYIDDPTNHATTCHDSTQLAPFVKPAGAPAPIVSQNPTTTAPSALLGALNSNLIVAGAPQGVQLNVTFDAGLVPSLTPPSVSGLGAGTGAGSLFAAVNGLAYTPLSRYPSGTSNGPFVTSDINGNDLQHPTQIATLQPFSYTLAAGAGAGGSCNTNFPGGSSSCPLTVDIRALTSYSRPAANGQSPVYGILNASCGGSSCHNPTTGTNVWTLDTASAQNTYTDVCGASQNCTTPKAGATSAIIVPGRPDMSTFYQAPCFGVTGMLPVFGPGDTRCKIIYQWILEGAPND
jgi:mono/diheme cytochrome c family protein